MTLNQPNKPKKIYFLCPGIQWDKPTTGGLLYNFVLISALKKKYGDYAVIPLDLVGGGQGRSWGLRRIISNLKYLRFLFGKKFGQADVVLVDSRANSLLLLPLLFLRFCSSVPVGLTVFHIYYHLSGRHGMIGMMEKYCEKLFIRCASFIITISRSTLQGIAQLAGRTESGQIPIWIIPPGLVTDDVTVERSDSLSASHECRLLYVGNCEDPRKGLDYLIRAVANLSHSHFKLDLAGKYDELSAYHQSLSSYITGNNLTNNVQFLGRVTDDKLHELYREADIFVFPSLWEGYGIVLAEAMSYGLPVVSTNVSSIPEIVSNGENGILVTPGSVELLTEALAELMDNDTLRQQMADKSIEIASRFKSWDEVGKILAAKIDSFVYQDVMEKK
jgi:glycosyltransferase involved in cell wall biosynthesis